MTTIRKATKSDDKLISDIGKVTVYEAHRSSCSEEDMNDYLKNNYSVDAIQKELSNENNVYHIIYYNEQVAGFSKIIFNTEHANIITKNVTKLDRIYLLKEFFDLKLGYELLTFNIQLSKENDQSGMWLFTWTGNQRAVNFYLKNGFTIIGSHQFKVSQTHSNPNYQMMLEF